MAARDPVDLLVGLSVGAQAAAAGRGGPAVDAAPAAHARLPDGRSGSADRAAPDRSLADGGPAGAARPARHAGTRLAHRRGRRLVRVVRSALRVRIEDVVGRVGADVTIVHAEYDPLTSYDFATAGLPATCELGDGCSSRPGTPTPGLRTTRTVSPS